MGVLGHKIGCEVITPSSDNLEKVWKTPHPNNHQEVGYLMISD